MSPIREQLVEMIDYLPEAEQFLLLEIARRFIADDVATADDLAAIDTARNEFAKGETISHDAINWN